MTAADKPRADLVALFDAFARLPEGNAMLSLFGGEHEESLRAWAEQHHRGVREQSLSNATDGRWSHLEVRVTGGWINVHCDAVKDAAQADQAVLARVQAVLDRPRALHLLLGMSEADIRSRWPGAIEALPPDVDRLAIDGTDGDLWLVHRDGSERVWLAEERTWSPGAQADQQVLARVKAALDGERNREPAPCAEGECKHAYDDWPASSVTQRDREFDQCPVCGWTEADVSRLRRIHAQERAAVESGWVELGTVKS